MNLSSLSAIYICNKEKEIIIMGSTKTLKLIPANYPWQSIKMLNFVPANNSSLKVVASTSHVFNNVRSQIVAAACKLASCMECLVTGATDWRSKLLEQILGVAKFLVKALKFVWSGDYQTPL